MTKRYIVGGGTIRSEDDAARDGAEQRQRDERNAALRAAHLAGLAASEAERAATNLVAALARYEPRQATERRAYLIAHPETDDAVWTRVWPLIAASLLAADIQAANEQAADQSGLYDRL